MWPHGDQTFCLELYEHSFLNGFDPQCEFAEERSKNGRAGCNKYKDPGQHYKQCCTMSGKTKFYTQFCAFNVPAKFNDKLSSWTFYRSHRRRNGVGCMKEFLNNTDTSLGKCAKGAVEQTVMDIAGLGMGPISPGEVWAYTTARESCSDSCAMGGQISPKCFEAMAMLKGGKIMNEALGVGMVNKYGDWKDIPWKNYDGFMKSLKGFGRANAAQVFAGAAVNFASCFVNEIRIGAAACLSPRTVFRGADQMGGVPLTSIDIESTITVVNVGNISSSGSVVGQAKVVSGVVLGFAKKKDNYTRLYTEIKTASGKSVQCTPKHYLWVKKVDGIAQLMMVEDVRKGYSLPVVGAPGSSVEWETIKEVTKGIEEVGAIVPIARTSDWETADMVVTDSGIAVPIYAGAPEYTALKPAGAHSLFKTWLRYWSNLHAELPCLMKISHGTHGSMLLELLQSYGQQHHAGKLGKVEMTPPEFLCYVHDHIKEFRYMINDADKKFVQECEGVSDMIKACNDEMRSTIDNDMAEDDGGTLIPDVENIGWNLASDGELPVAEEELMEEGMAESDV